MEQISVHKGKAEDDLSEMTALGEMAACQRESTFGRDEDSEVQEAPHGRVTGT